MKRTSRMKTRLLLGVLLLGISLHPFALPEDARGVEVNIASGAAGWKVYETNGDGTKGKYLGSPQNVCFSATSKNCPPGATNYEFGGDGWPVDISSIPVPGAKGAKWIWAPGINRQTSPAAYAEFIFEYSFYLCGDPKPGIISVAADDSAQVFLNDSLTPVLTSTASNVFTTVNIPAESIRHGLHGPNVITVKVKNKYLDSCKDKDNYQCNPAGMVFGAFFADQLDALPTCTDPSGKVGDVRNLGPCTSPLMGSKYSACICIGSAAGWFDYDTCMQPPPPCTGYTYSDWSACTDGQQRRKDIGKTPPGCIGDPSTKRELTQACPLICTSFTYSSWGECGSDSTMRRAVLTSSPPGCTGGTPETTKTSFVGVGDVCWDYNLGGIGCCPSGTECGSRRTPYEDCSFFGLFCSTRYLVSTNMFCDPK